MSSQTEQAGQAGQGSQAGRAAPEHDRKGLLLGAGAYLVWCIFPIYFRLLEALPPLEIVMWRIVWSLVFMVFVISGLRRWTALRLALRQRRVLLVYCISALLLGSNWFIYIWSVNNEHVLEGSLGYYINPLVNVLLGVLFLRERLRAGQWACLALAGAGVSYLTWEHGQLPWIALSLALTFGFYGLVKKRAPLPAAEGMTIETGVLFLPALIGVIWFMAQGAGPIALGGTSLATILLLSGPITAVPLLMFAAAAQRIPLSMLGVLQYIAPTGQFLVAIFVFHEPFPPEQMIGFAIIWAALALFWVESLVNRRRVQAQAARVEVRAAA